MGGSEPGIWECISQHKSHIPHLLFRKSFGLRPVELRHGWISTCPPPSLLCLTIRVRPHKPNLRASPQFFALAWLTPSLQLRRDKPRRRQPFWSGSQVRNTGMVEGWNHGLRGIKPIRSGLLRFRSPVFHYSLSGAKSKRCKDNAIPISCKNSETLNYGVSETRKDSGEAGGYSTFGLDD